MANLASRRPTLADQIAREQAAGAAPCGHSCWCHSTNPCIRAPHDSGVAHVAQGDDGLVQWSGPCPPVDADGVEMTPERGAQIVADYRRAHTETFLANVDLDQLAAALKGRL